MCIRDRNLFKDHSDTETLWRATHRFNACTEVEFFRLCKDLTRLLIERIDLNALKTLTPECPAKLKTLKRFEKLLSKSHSDARSLFTPWHGIYEFRKADAHLTSASIAEARQAVGCEDENHPVGMAKLTIAAMADSVNSITSVL